MKFIFTIIEHIDFISWWRGWESTNRRNTGIDKDIDEKGNKKGNTGGQDRRFSQTPPWGGATEGVVRWRTPLPLGDKWDITKTFKSKNRQTADTSATGVKQKSQTALVSIDVGTVIRG